MFKNMKILKKLVVSFIIVTLISSISGIMGSVLLKKVDTDYSFALENYGFAQGKIGRLGMEVNSNRAFIRDIIFLTEQTQLDEAYAKIQASITAINGLLTEVAATNTSTEAKELFTKIETGISSYRVHRDKVIEYGMVNNETEAYKIWINDAYPIIETVATDITALMKMNNEAGTAVSNNLSALGQVMIIVMIATVIVGAIISIIIAVLIARGISRPVIAVAEAATKLSHGDFDTDLTYHSLDEIGSLFDSMREMVTSTNSIISDTSRGLNEFARGNFNVVPQADYVGVYNGISVAMEKIVTELSRTFTDIRVSAEQVSSGAEQVSSGAQALAQGTTEQASSIQELSASVNEIAEQVKDNADSAKKASQLAGVVGINVQESNNQMSQMTEAMFDISTSSSQISKIIKAIEDIAFQTNILALNAAVEAARAGAAGKGFAVVADEVRNLATKSSEAAKQTNVLIEDSVKAVTRGSSIAELTAKSLTEVVSGSEQIAQIITEISKASSEQSTSISQINIGVEQISSVVQTNSATSEESAAASEEMAGQATVLNELMSKFQVRR